MANLAGFDVVFELHFDTIADCINAKPVKNPLDGSSVFLLGGPFTTSLQLNLGSLGTAGVQAILNFTLQPVRFQSITQISVSIDGGSFGPGPLNAVHIAGTASVTVPFGFVGLPQEGPIMIWLPQEQPHEVYPAFLLGSAETSVVLVHESRAQIDAAIGNGGADRVQNALAHALRDWIRKAGTQYIDAFKFRVVPGVDSDDVEQLSAAPIAAWIDSSSLGIFGYYRATASGGDVTAKTDSDVAQFYYGKLGARIATGRRVALLLTAEQFHRMLVCPTIRDKIIESLYYKQVYPGKLGYWTGQMLGTVEDENDEELKSIQDSYRQHLLQYRFEETNNAILTILDNPGMDADARSLEFSKAEARAYGRALNAVEFDLEELTKARLTAYLLTSGGKLAADGLREVTAVMPLPCGGGEVELLRQKLDNPLPDIVPMLHELALTPENGFLKLRFVVLGNFELITGDISYSLAAEFSIRIAIDDAGNISIDVQPLVFDHNYDANSVTGVYLDFLRDFFTSPAVKAFCWRVAMAIADEIEKELTQNLNKQLPNIPTSVAGAPAQLLDFNVEPSSLAIIGVIGRRARWNNFNPGVAVNATVAARKPSSQRSKKGTLYLERTAWGCDAAEFGYLRTFWDTTVTIRAIPRDLAAPFTFSDWAIDIGHVGPAIMGGQLIWGQTPAPIAAGSFQVSGVIHQLEPPLDGVNVQRSDIAVDASGDNDRGWTLTFNGKDGIFYVHVSMRITDGDGKQWPGEVYFAIKGEQLDMSNPAAYNAYKTGCDAKYKLWSKVKFGHLVEIAHINPGDPIIDPIIREAATIRSLAAVGDPSVVVQITAAAQKFGDRFFQVLGKVQRGEIAPPQKIRPG